MELILWVMGELIFYLASWKCKVVHFREGLVAKNLRFTVQMLLGGLPQPHEVDVDALAEDVVDHLGRLLGDGVVKQP